jgi:site-specific recombinase XerD
MFCETDRGLLDGFLNYLERIGRAPSTRCIYGRAIDQLVEATEKRLCELGTLDVDAYLAGWRESFFRDRARFPRAATYRNRVNALRAFYAWMERFDHLRAADGTLVPNPMRWVETPRVEQQANDWLRPTEDRALLSAPIPEHERFIILLLRCTGLRVSEAVSLAASDVDLTHGNETIFVRESKTSAGRRAIPVLPALLTELGCRIETVRRATAVEDAPILITRNRSSMKPSYVWRVVKRACFRAGVRVVPCICDPATSVHVTHCPRTRTGENLSRVSPHTLRRTFGSHLLNSGVRLEVVSKLLGHASTSITEKAYAELLYETARRELFAALRGTDDRLTRGG